ncbi:transcriptional regulator, partial [Streptomyces sp. NPDC002055]
AWAGRRLALAAAAAAALLGAAGLVVGQISDPEIGRPAGSAPVGNDTVSDDEPPRATTSPSASPSRSAKPSVSASRGKGGEDGPVPGSPADPPSAGTSPSSAPASVTVATRPYAWENPPCSRKYLVDRSPDDVGPPPGEQDAPRWVRSLDAVSAGDQLVELTVQGTGKDTVVVQGLDVHVVSSRAPLDRNVYSMGVGCGGDVVTRSFGVDLDAGRPQTSPRDGQRDFPYKVSESDPEVFYVLAGTQTHDVSWYLELRWSSGDRQGTVRIDDHGKPFRTSGTGGSPHYDYPLGGNEWIRNESEQ